MINEQGKQRIENSKFEGHTTDSWGVSSFDDKEVLGWGEPSKTTGLRFKKLIARFESKEDAKLGAAAPDLLKEKEQLRAELERSEKLLQEYREVLTEILHYIHDYSLTGIQDRDYRKSLQSLEYRVKSLIEPKTDKA